MAYFVVADAENAAAKSEWGPNAEAHEVDAVSEAAAVTEFASADGGAVSSDTFSISWSGILISNLLALFRMELFSRQKEGDQESVTAESTVSGDSLLEMIVFVDVHVDLIAFWSKVGLWDLGWCL